MTNRTGMTKMLPIIFVIGASLVISSGMAAPAAALPLFMDEQDPTIPADFDIKQVFLDSNGELNIQVYGKAGGTVPQDMNTVYAYVVFTNDGIFATDSHEAQHSESSGETTANKAWHGHKVTIKPNGGPNGRDCLVEIGSLDAEARMSGSNVKIIGAHASDITMAVTTALTLLHEDPDSVPAGECVAEVVATPFDIALGRPLIL
jgi:hypothetical protein